jgi:hypothetical protein
MAPGGNGGVDGGGRGVVVVMWCWRSSVVKYRGFGALLEFIGGGGMVSAEILWWWSSAGNPMRSAACGLNLVMVVGW